MTVSRTSRRTPKRKSKAAHGTKTKRARYRSGLSPSRDQVRIDGRELRRMTIYLPVALAKRLARYSAAHDTNMSDVVAEFLAERLGRRGG